MHNNSIQRPDGWPLENQGALLGWFYVECTAITSSLTLNVDLKHRLGDHYCGYYVHLLVNKSIEETMRDITEHSMHCSRVINYKNYQEFRTSLQGLIFDPDTGEGESRMPGRDIKFYNGSQPENY